MMKRRTFLSSMTVASVGLTGCSSKAEETDGKTVSVESVTGFGEKVPLKFSVDVVKSEFKKSPQEKGGHPAIIDVSIANDSGDIIDVSSGHRKYFSDTYSEKNRYILLSDTLDYSFIKYNNSCWEVTEPVSFSEYTTGEIHPEETATERLRVLGYRNGGCLPEKKATFKQTYKNLHIGSGKEVSFELKIS